MCKSKRGWESCSISVLVQVAGAGTRSYRLPFSLCSAKGGQGYPIPQGRPGSWLQKFLESRHLKGQLLA